MILVALARAAAPPGLCECMNRLNTQGSVLQEDLWVPVVRMKSRLIVLPGVPRLFTSLLDGYLRYIPLPPDSSKPFRLLMHTEMPESSIAPFLTELSERTKGEGIRVGRSVHFAFSPLLLGKCLADRSTHETQQLSQVPERSCESHRSAFDAAQREWKGSLADGATNERRMYR